MPSPNYIVKNHNGIYYFRYIIPKKLLHHSPNQCREFRKSLKTRCKRDAIKKARKLSVIMDDKIKSIANFEAEAEEHEHSLRNGKQLFAQLEEYDELANEHFDNGILGDFISRLDPRQERDLKLYIEYKNNIDVPKENQKEIKIQSKKINNEKIKDIKDLETIIHEYISIKENYNDIAITTSKSYKSHCLSLCWVLDNPLVSDFNQELISKFINILPKLPTRINSTNIYKNKTVDEVLSMDYEDTLSSNTMRAYFTSIKQFLSWGADTNYFDTDYSSSLKTITKRNSKNSYSDEQVSVFSLNDLKKIFITPEYQKDCFRGMPFRYWLPLLGLYTGARLNELCQLLTKDIKKEHVIDYINILDNNSENQGTKNNLDRVIPIHKKLIELGFLDYVEEVKKRGEHRLFPQLTLDSNEKYLRKVSRFFNLEYKEKTYGKGGFLGYAGINKHSEEGKKVYHSFRHTFINLGKQNKFDKNIINELCGHSHGGDMFLSVYGKEYELKIKHEEINKITFDVKHPRKWHKSYYD